MAAGPEQVSDDPKLLELMLEGMREAPDFYKPTNYWAYYENKSLPELQRMGLHDFRRRRFSILSTFGATDLSLRPLDFFRTRKLNRLGVSPFLLRFLFSINKFLNKVLLIQRHYDTKAEKMGRSAFDFARSYGEKVGARSIHECEASVAGNPEYVIRIGRKTYTMSMLYYYLRYAYCCNFVDFDDIRICVELGGGCGKQIEVLKKLHPDICFLLFDIPPQLYVCQQYLSAVFPDSVVSYRETRRMSSISGPEKGKVFIFGNWKFPIIEKLNIDLFWNAASFQEMEPEIVANYLYYINKSASHVFLQQNMSGKKLAQKKGDVGVMEQTTLEDYKKGLANFELIDLSPCVRPTGDNLSGYSDSFWRRKDIL